MDLNILNQPVQVGPKTAPNRLANHPMECNDADENGSPSEHTFKRYKSLAEGGAGVINIESITISPTSRARKNQLVAQEKNLKGLADLVEAMKKINDRSLIIIQLNHSGAISNPNFSEAVSYYPTGHPDERILNDDDIDEIADWFVTSAKVCHETGADGLDFKMCHGYLGGQLLRPANITNGKYGGSWENRTRFFRETATRIKDEINNPNFIIGSRISFYEGIPGGFGSSGPEDVTEDPTEPLAFCRMIEEAGFHFINVSSGIPVMTGEFCRPTKLYPEGVYRQFSWARQVRQAVKTPLIGTAYSYLRDGNNKLVGKDPEKKSLLYWAAKNISDGHVDMVGIGRQSLADPLFARKALAGDLEEINYCAACGGCSKLLGGQALVGCVIYDEFYKEQLRMVREASKS